MRRGSEIPSGGDGAKERVPGGKDVVQPRRPIENVETKAAGQGPEKKQGTPGDSPARAMANLLERVPPEKAARILEKMEVEKAARILDVMEIEGARNVFLKMEFEKMEPTRAAEMITVMAKKDITQAADTLGAMDSNVAARIGKRIEPDVLADVSATMDSGKAADLMAKMMEIGDESVKLPLLTRIKQTLFIGAGALLSTAVSGAIDQAQIIEQQKGINSLVVDSYAGGLAGSFVVGNLFYRFTQRWMVPEKVPIIGGKTLGSSTNTYQISFSIAWATVGTIVQLVLRPYVFNKL